MLGTVTRDELIVAGWVPAREIPTPKLLGQTLPARMLTISSCLQEDDVPRPEPLLGPWFQDPDDAKQTAAGTAGQLSSIVTVAMQPHDAEELMAQWDAEHSPWFNLLRQRRPLTHEARILGYEVVGAEEYLDFHSWHCHGYADEVHTALGVRTNSKSLIPNYAAAQSVLSWMLTRPYTEAPKPVPWTVVALAAEE